MKYILAALVFFGLVSGHSLAAEAGEHNSLHDFKVKALDYSPMDFAQFKGKTVLLVNTASFCGYTPQYEGLQALYDDYKDRGLVVLGVPSNDFGEQEPHGEKEIKEFCEMTYSVKFPMTKKMQVNGKPGTSELYTWLASKLGDKSLPKWNFHKFLIGADGQPITYFKSGQKPRSKKVIAAIEEALSANGR